MDLHLIENIKAKKLARKIEYYEEINSTHTYAKRNINKLVDGTVILAESQTAGKGTRERKWYTGKGKNIAITIILKPYCNIEKIKTLTIDTAILIQEAIKELYGYILEIRKPNDLILNNKKIAGILTESSTLGGELKYIILSIGFNVNEDKFDDNTKEIATSLKKEFNKDFSREEIIANIIKKLDEYYILKIL